MATMNLFNLAAQTTQHLFLDLPVKLSSPNSYIIEFELTSALTGASGCYVDTLQPDKYCLRKTQPHWHAL